MWSSSEPVYRCPGCQHKQSTKREAAYFIVYFTLFLFAAAGVFISPGPGFLVFMLNLSLFGLFYIPGTILHEAGHAFAGLLAKWHVSKVVIGWYGKPLFTFRFAGFSWQFNSIPAGGFVCVFPRDERLFRLKSAFVCLAGPCANLIAAAVCFLLADSSFNELDQDVLPLLAFGASNFLGFCVSIFPRQLSTAGQSLSTDGMLVIEALFRPVKAKQKQLVSGFLMEFQELHEAGLSHNAVSRLDQLRARYPADFLLAITHGILLLDIQRYSEARSTFVELLKTGTHNPYYEAMLFNNIAWTNLMLDDPALLAESLAYSEKAVNAFSNTSPFLGTRGSVLVQAGKFKEGIALLKASLQLKERTESQGKALNFCMLSIAEQKLGNSSEAAHYLQLARESDPACPLLTRAAQACDAPSAEPA